MIGLWAIMKMQDFKCKQSSITEVWILVPQKRDSKTLKKAWLQIPQKLWAQRRAAMAAACCQGQKCLCPDTAIHSHPRSRASKSTLFSASSKPPPGAGRGAGRHRHCWDGHSGCERAGAVRLQPTLAAAVLAVAVGVCAVFDAAPILQGIRHLCSFCGNHFGLCCLLHASLGRGLACRG